MITIELIGRCEQVFINGYPLRQVLAREQLSRGTFFVDLDAKLLYVQPADNREIADGKAQVEASSRDRILTVKGDYVTVEGIRFRYAANRAQQGAVEFSGDHITVENCVFEHTNSSGAEFSGDGLVVRNCTFQHNGQLGFGANRAHRLLMTGCTIRNNNTKGFDRGLGGRRRQDLLDPRGHSRKQHVHRESRQRHLVRHRQRGLPGPQLPDRGQRGRRHLLRNLLRPARPRQRDRRQRLRQHAGRLGRRRRHQHLQLAGLHDRAQSHLRQQRRFQLPRADPQHAPDRQQDNPSRSGITTRSSATTSWPGTATPRSGAGSTSPTNATGPSRCRRSPPTPLVRSVARRS